MAGGNVNEVVRVGETVRRSAKPNEYANELLLFLEKQGFHQAPRYLGMDEKGREMLSYLEGDVPGDDYPEIDAYMWSDEALIAAAQLLRTYHDATASFTTRAQPGNRFPGMQVLRKGLEVENTWLVESELELEVVCHNDFAPYNLVFRNGLPQGVIDFDMAAPGPRLWDIAYTLYTCVPLASFSPLASGHGKAVTSYNKESHAAIRKRRIKLFMDAYGMKVPPTMKNWVVSRIRFMCRTLEERAAAGDAAFVKMVEEGHLAHYEQEVLFLEQHWQDWA
nr:aminoglycoside phosphotransferase family protein [Paenibacillus silvae]